MNFNWAELQKLLGKITKYAQAKIKPANIGVLKRHLISLNRFIAELQEYDSFQTAGPWQFEVSRKLKECRIARQKLKLLISWYGEMAGNSRTARWKREFFEQGAAK